jgi:hypothetical protein
MANGGLSNIHYAYPKSWSDKLRNEIRVDCSELGAPTGVELRTRPSRLIRKSNPQEILTRNARHCREQPCLLRTCGSGAGGQGNGRESVVKPSFDRRFYRLTTSQFSLPAHHGGRFNESSVNGTCVFPSCLTGGGHFTLWGTFEPGGVP